MKFIIIVSLVFVIAILALKLRSSGPRVTTIEHRREETDVDRKDEDA